MESQTKPPEMADEAPLLAQLRDALRRIKALEDRLGTDAAPYIDRDERPDAVEAEPEIEPTRKMIPDEIGELMEAGETIAEARERLWSKLNDELAELQNQEALFGKSIPRRAEVENLLGILARLGEY